MFSVASEAARNLSAHIGARTVTMALFALFSTICLAVLSSIHPPQLKPMTVVARKPATAPCKSRVRDSPCRIEGNSMMFPFARHRSERGQRRPGWVPVDRFELKEGAAKREGGICSQNALIDERCLYKIAHSPIIAA